jgi:hypothetical protein
MRELIINSDSDGVIYQWTETILKMGQFHFNREEPYPTPTGWNLETVMGLEYDEFWHFFHLMAQNGVFRHGEPVPGAIEALRKFIKDKHRVRVITNKHLREERSTYHACRDMVGFLFDHGLLQEVEVILAIGKYKKQDFPADVVIDDKPDLSWYQPEAEVNILFDQPWNHETQINGRSNLVRASDWEQVKKIVDEVAQDDA